MTKLTLPFHQRQGPAVWFATRSLFTVLSSAYAMCAQPRLSIVSMMKSRRLRFDAGAKQKMPRLQMSPMCIGVVVIGVTAQVAASTPLLRFRDCAPYRFQAQAGG